MKIKNKFRQLLLAAQLFAWSLGRIFTKPPGVQFANLNEGSHEHGIKSYLPNAGLATGATRYLLVKGGTDGDHCTPCNANDTPLGSTDDVIDSNNLDIPIAVKLFGAVKGTTRLISDGTITSLCRVTTGGSGQATLQATGANGHFGIALVPTDTLAPGGTVAAGDTFECIVYAWNKASF